MSSRRQFMQATATAAGALTLTSLSASRVLGADQRISFGVIGCGGMGTGHIGQLVKRGKDDNIRVSVSATSTSGGSTGPRLFARAKAWPTIAGCWIEKTSTPC